MTVTMLSSLTNDSLSTDEITHARYIIQSYCPDLLKPNDDDGFTTNNSNYNNAIVTMIAWAKHLRIPLLSWIMNVHHRSIINDQINPSCSYIKYTMDNRVDYIAHEPYDVDITNYYLMQYLHQNSPKLHHLFKHSVSTFSRHLFQYPVTQNLFTTIKYDDDFYDYCHLTTYLFDAVDRLTKRWTAYRSTVPFQMDVWIIPKNVISPMTDKLRAQYLVQGYCKDIDTFNTIPTELIQLILQFFGTYDIIGNIKEKLQLNEEAGNIEEYRFWEEDGYGPALGKSITYKTFYSQNAQRNLCGKRYVLIIDRRPENVSEVHYYRSLDVIHTECLDYFKCPNFFYSAKCVLPGDPKQEPQKNIGLFDHVNGYMFGLSFHVNSIGSMDLYWSRHGSAYRMNGDDMIHIWPKYFVAKPSYYKNNRIKNRYNDRFDKFYTFSSGNSSVDQEFYRLCLNLKEETMFENEY